MLIYQNTANIPDQVMIDRVADENGISKLLAQMLIHRGLKTPEEINRFLHPSEADFHDPMGLADMKNAVTRIQKAIEEEEQICIYGDYDVDGICATTLMLRCLKPMGAKVDYYIPSRHTQGYGMHIDAIKQLAADGVRLIITVDNGISALDEIAVCADLGIDVIVTDHHQCAIKLPQCCAVVCTTRTDNSYLNCNLCGAGVALKVAQALGKQIDGADLAITALATVADVVPLLDENRAIVALGLREVMRLPGLQALITISGYEGKVVDTMVVGYGLAPRLNAAGRMGCASRGVELLLEQDMRKARMLAETLDEENRKRQAEEMRILKNAHEQLETYDFSQDCAILLYGEDWNPGVIGVVASRLMEEYYRPVILFHKHGDLLSGSGRSIPQIHLFDCLNKFSNRMVRFGGHAQAAGMTIKEEEFLTFKRDLNAYMRSHISKDALMPCRNYEIEISMDQVNVQLVRDIERLAPFGEGNPKPVFRTREIELRNLQRMGKELQHVKATIDVDGNVLPMVAFGSAKQLDKWLFARKFDILYSPNLNAYKGRTQLQMIARCIRAMPLTEQEITQKSYRQKFYDAYVRNRLLQVMNDNHIKIEDDLDTCMVQRLKEDICGTLVVCMTPAGAQKLLSTLENNGLLNHVDLTFSKNDAHGVTYNSVVFAPDYAQMKTEDYRTVIIYDGKNHPFLYNMGTMQQTLLAGSYDGERELLQVLNPARDAMGVLYRQFCACLKTGAKKRAALLIQMEQWIDYEAAALALGVFLELEFFEWNAQTDMITYKQTPNRRLLETSKLYCDICKSRKQEENIGY